MVIDRTIATVYWELSAEKTIHEIGRFWDYHKCFLVTIFLSVNLIAILTKALGVQ